MTIAVTTYRCQCIILMHGGTLLLDAARGVHIHGLARGGAGDAGAPEG